jgi:hypothetical protein
MRKSRSAALLCAVFVLSAVTARPQDVRQVTIEPETKARLILQSHINSKLNEPGDPISAILDAPVYVNGEMALPGGAEFVGRVTEVKPAGRGQKNGSISVIFEHVRVSSRDVPVFVEITSIDDFTTNEKMKADEEGEVKGSRSGRRTAENVGRGGTIGGAGGLATVLLGGGRAAGGSVVAGGMLGGLLLTKGGDVRIAPGAVVRVKFDKPLSLPVVESSGAPSRPGNR